MTLDSDVRPHAPLARPGQDDTPYADALNEFARRDLVRVIVPGHSAQEGGVPDRLARLIADKPFAKDWTPLLTGLDKGNGNPLDRAKELAAEAWGARRVWFLTNGASQGNRVAALALGCRGTGVVSQRSSHSSFVDGLILSGLAPRFVLPSIDRVRGIAHGVTPEALEAVIAEGRTAADELAGVYVISPSYFGAVADVAGLAAVAHRHGLPLVVDAAWGAHFGFSPLVPENPLRLGADLVVSSTHKLGQSLTQSAMLHLADGPFADELEPLVDRAFHLEQSTSENTWLLASLDIARHHLSNGGEAIARSVRSAEMLRAAVRASEGLTLVEDSFTDFPDIVGMDPLHVPIDVSALGVSGHEVKEVCANELGVYFEASSLHAVIALIGAGATPDVERIVASLVEGARIVREQPDDGARAGAPGGVEGPGRVHVVPQRELPAAGPGVLTPREAFLAVSEVVTAEHAVGRVSSDTLAAYPPGIPNLLPGERITAEIVDFLRETAASPGGFIRGAVDRESSLFRVVAAGESERSAARSARRSGR